MPKYIAYRIVETDKLTTLEDNEELKALSEYGLIVLHMDYFEAVLKELLHNEV